MDEPRVIGYGDDGDTVSGTIGEHRIRMSIVAQAPQSVPSQGKHHDQDDAPHNARIFPPDSLPPSRLRRTCAAFSERRALRPSAPASREPPRDRRKGMARSVRLHRDVNRGIPVTVSDLSMNFGVGNSKRRPPAHDGRRWHCRRERLGQVRSSRSYRARWPRRAEVVCPSVPASGCSNKITSSTKTPPSSTS